MNAPTRISLGLLSIAVSIPGHAQTSVHGARRESRAAERKTRFETDSRLDRRISMSPRSATHSRLWAMLWRRSGAQIECDAAAREVADSPLAIAANDVSVRSLMDAIAALVDARWKHTERKTYLLMVGEDELDQVFLPNSAWERERFSAGRPFLDALNDMPAPERQAIESGSNRQFSDLPSNLQQPIADMLDSLSREYRNKGAGETVSPSNLARCSVRIQRKPASGFNRIFVTVTDPGVVTSGWRLNDYEERKVAGEGTDQARSGVAQDIYSARTGRSNSGEAKSVPQLKKRISIDLTNATFPRVLKHLNEAYGVSFVCDAEQFMPQRVNVRIVNTTMAEALDALVKLYKGTEWEWRKMGVLVVRGPANPVRSQPAQAVKSTQ